MATRDVQDQLHEGETVQRELVVGTADVVVTDKRLLVFAPETPGKNYRAVERPNVEGVSVETRSEPNHLLKGVAVFVLGGILMGLGLSFDTDGLFALPSGADPSAVGGASGAFSLIKKVRTAVGLLDDVALYGGLVVGLVALVFVGLYVRSRQEVIAFDVAGENPIDIPTDRVEVPRETSRELNIALELGGPSAPAGESDVERDTTLEY